MLLPLEATDEQVIQQCLLLRRLPPGGMADVYLARAADGELIVIKVAKPDPDGAFSDRFAKESVAAALVAGPYIAKCLGIVSFGSPSCVATEYVPGPSLSEAVHLHGPLPVATIRALIAGLCEALLSIHAAGVVHRDLTPRNVLLRPDGPRVIDFGIARIATAATVSLGRPLYGTRGYVAPEQLQDPRNATGATDVHALGAVIHFACTGRPPEPDGRGRPDLAEVPAELRSLVAACLAADPNGRPTLPQVLDQVRPAGTSTEDVLRPGWLPADLLGEMRLREKELRDLRADPRPVRRVARSVLRRVVGIGALLVVLAAGAAVAVHASGAGRGAGETAPNASPASPASRTPESPGPRFTADAGHTDAYPCTAEPPRPHREALRFPCPLIWDAGGTGEAATIPVFATYTVADLTPDDAVDQLVKTTGAQYFACQISAGARYTMPSHAGNIGPEHDWWALTQGDQHGTWGFVPETYLLGGDDFRPDPGLPTCTPDQLAKAR